MKISTPPTERVLYQFPISHYCEKSRWNLDAKGLSYRVSDLMPGLHMVVARRVAGIRTVPVLVDRGVPIGDSTAIAEHLDRAYPDKPLLPVAEPLRSRALELEKFFGDRPGKAVRLWMYGQLLGRRGGAAEVFFANYSQPIQLLGKVVGPLFELAIRKEYRIEPDRIGRARERIVEAFDRIERETSEDPGRYLVGDVLSIADISAASMLGPLVAPRNSPWERTRGAAPESVMVLRALLSKRPGWAWVEARYDRDRRASN